MNDDLIAQSRSGPGAQGRYRSRNISSVVVIALFSSQFELESGSRGVRLSMDLSVARARPGDGCGTAGGWHSIGPSAISHQDATYLCSAGTDRLSEEQGLTDGCSPLDGR